MGNNLKNLSDDIIAAFLDGNVNAEELNLVLSSIGCDKELTEILSVADAIDLQRQDEERRIIPMRALAAANPDNLCSFKCETYILKHLDFDVDHWTLLETAKANNWVREEGTPLHHVGRLLELKGLHVERKYDASIEDIESAIANGKEIIIIIDNHLLDKKYNPKGTYQYHAIYITGVQENGAIKYLNPDTLEESIINKEDFLKAWGSSSNYMVTTSKNTLDYNPQPIFVEDIELDASLEDLTEAIAENAHDIWARARMDEGWTYGPVRDDANKRHPDLVHYSQLSESEKEYDRLMAMNTLRLVRRLGYKFVKE